VRPLAGPPPRALELRAPCGFLPSARAASWLSLVLTAYLGTY